MLLALLALDRIAINALLVLPLRAYIKVLATLATQHAKVAVERPLQIASAAQREGPWLGPPAYCAL